jgi:polar amino acid transport system substrate-binding protein
MGLMWFMLLVGITGMAVDVTDGMAQGLLDEPGDQELTAVQTTEEPTQTAEEPVQTAEEPVQTAKQLVQRIALPAQSFTGSVPMIEESYETVADPILTTVEPVRMAEEPVQTFKEPRQIAATPMPAAVEPVQVTANTMAVPPLAELQIKFLTGSAFAPFAGESLHAGGMITDLVTRAVNTAAPEQEFRVTFISDWSALLDVLLRDGAFDVSFPWYKPDCSEPEKLGEELRIQCDEFEFSNPFYEVSLGYYTRTGDPLVKADSHASLFGKKLCRPKRQFMFDLDQNNPTAPNVSVETAATAIECFFRLLRGQVDVVSLVKSKADAELRRLGIIDEVAEIEGLETSHTLHALVSKSNPDGRAYLDIINQGMASLMASGKWFEVVAYHQSRQLALMN